MLGAFDCEIVTPPEELVAARNQSPSPRTTASALLTRYTKTNLSSVSVQNGEQVKLAYSRQNESLLWPRLLGVKDEIFCLFEGMLDNLGSLRQEYGLAKSADEVMLVIEAYKTLRDRAPYPPSRVDQSGRVPLFWEINADGFVAFSDDAEMLKGACGKLLASFPPGCFFSTAVGELRSYENPKNKITAIPAAEEEMRDAKFKVEGPTVVAATE